MALVSVDAAKVNVDCLASAPWNLDEPDIMKICGKKGIKGAGSAAIEEAIFLCMRRNLPLELFALESSIPFYEKLGFEGPMNEMRLPLNKCSRFFRACRGGAIPINAASS